MAVVIIVYFTHYQPLIVLLYHGQINLIAPLSWEHHLVFILPAIFVGFSLIVSRAMNQWIAIGSFAAAGIVLAWKITLKSNLLKTGLLTCNFL